MREATPEFIQIVTANTRPVVLITNYRRLRLHRFLDDQILVQILSYTLFVESSQKWDIWGVASPGDIEGYQNPKNDSGNVTAWYYT